MGFQARKSIRIAPGVRVNVSKSGVGMSAGVGGARYSAHSSGRRTVSARTGIPGVTYQKSVGGGRSGSRPTPQASTPKPGLFAPKGEKLLYNAVKDQRDLSTIKAIGEDHPDVRIAAWSLAGLGLMDTDTAVAGRLLEEIFGSGKDPGEDSFVTKYLSTRLSLTIATGVTAELPVNRDAVGLALAELKQDAGDISGAIAVVEQLEPTTFAAVSLAELYTVAKRPADVIDLTDGVTNEDDASALLLCFRGMALRDQGLYTAAHEAFKEALRKRNQPSEIRHRTLVERAENYVAQGKVGMARKDLERILAEDSRYEGVRERLTELT